MPSIQQMLNDVGFDVETDYIDLGGALADVRDHTVPWPFLMSQNGATELGSPAGAGFAWTLIGRSTTRTRTRMRTTTSYRGSWTSRR